MSTGPYRAAVIDELSGSVSIHLSRRTSDSYAIAIGVVAGDLGEGHADYFETAPDIASGLGPLLRLSYEELAALEEAIVAFRGQRLEAATEAVLLRESLTVERARLDRLLDRASIDKRRTTVENR